MSFEAIVDDGQPMLQIAHHEPMAQVSLLESNIEKRQGNHRENI